MSSLSFTTFWFTTNPPNPTVGLITGNPVTVYPPPPGRRASAGAVMLMKLKSDGASARLSASWKLPYSFLKKPTSRESREASCCCTLTPNSQLYPRFPQPVCMLGSNASWVSSCETSLLPNVRTLNCPHSPFGATLVRLQSGTKFLFESVQVRVALPNAPTVADTGLGSGTMASVVPNPSRYLLAVTLIAVLPLPLKSYVRPNFGVMSFQLTCCVSGNVMFRFGTSGPGPSVVAG